MICAAIATQSVNDVYSENHMKHINTLSERNAELFNVKAGGRLSNHCILAGT
jgi:hypothetical protein